MRSPWWKRLRILAGLAGGALAACSSVRDAGTRPGESSPLLVVVSFDGFRWDYPELHGAPTLLAMAREGARAPLVPSFPSKTYPNHYTIATGLRPEHHGIVANTMRDPLWNARFSLADRSAVEDGRWWEGEPIWVTAERAGLPTAASYWPGTEAEIGGIRPRDWRRYDDSVPDNERVDEILGWLDRPEAERPRLLMLYFDEPDGAGHRFGPGSAETRAAVFHVDAMLAKLRAGVAARGLASATNWIVVSDHGMTDSPPERVIVLEELVHFADIAEVDANVVGLIEPVPGRAAAVLEALARAHPHLHAARREEVPERLHFRSHRRIPEIVVWVDPGWTLLARRPEGGVARISPGNHGYDPAAADMHGLFIAQGPAFRRGVAAPKLENVHLYELFCALLGVAPAANDGDPGATRWARRDP